MLKNFSISKEDLVTLKEAYPNLFKGLDLDKLVTNEDGFKHLLFSKFNFKDAQKESEIKDLAFMVDCSRNAVLKVETVKTLIHILAILGYNTLMLYLEDVYEVNNEPYFGYLRGRYTKDELNEIVKYATRFNLEVVPCIQTLAHYNQLVRWYDHQNVFDIADILLVGEKRQEVLLDNIFATLRECFATSRINIGMDEAYLIGRGKYFDRHGSVDRFSIMKQQLDFVETLCHKYNFKPMMWSDMFFRLAFDNYYNVKGELPSQVIDLVKDRFALVYWDYYHVELEHYQTMLDIHLNLKTDVYFAGGAWKWSGFTPDNRFAIETMRASIKACKEKHIPLYIVTAWGDNGAESSLFSILPSLIYAALARDGIDTRENLDLASTLLSSLTMEEFMYVDSANRGFIEDHLDRTNSTNKFLLFNDPLLGVMDSLASFIDPSKYEVSLSKLSEKKYKEGLYSYVFDTQKALLKVLRHKARLGIAMRDNYRTQQKENLAKLAQDVDIIIHDLDEFMKVFAQQWEKENKPHGFDVQDLRLGGLKQRLIATKAKLHDYLNGITTSIPELEEEILDYMCNGREYTFDTRNCEYRLHRISSVNVND